MLQSAMSRGEAAVCSARLPLIDAARGTAILAMAVYHFSWDLQFFGYIAADVTRDLGWRIFARLIAGSFLFLVGVSLVLATRAGFDRKRYLRRILLVSGAAAAITAATYVAFPDSFIFFGILHCIAVSSVLALPFLRWPVPAAIAAAAFCFVAPQFLSGPVFDHPALIWLGLATYFPRSNDFVPIFPWFGVVLAGVACARLALRFRPEALNAASFGSRAPWPLVWAGRHSLAIYLLHQPVLIGILYLAAQIRPPELTGFETSYVESCTASCVASDIDAGHCAATCGCLVERTKAEELWAPLIRDRLSPDQVSRYYGLADECRAAADLPSGP